MQILFLVIWLLLVVYAVFLAPPFQPASIEFVINTFQFNLAEVEPLAFMVFNLLGVWPLIFATVLLSDGFQQRVPSWPFILLSFGTGAFALLPYLAFRTPHTQFTNPPSRSIKIIEHKLVALVLFVITTGLVIIGIAFGNFADFTNLWLTDRLVNVMTIDAALVTLLFPYVLYDDMHRRQYYCQRRYIIFSIIPLFGPLLYLLIRPSL